MDLENIRILIVGAGIAGLALGLALRRRGCIPHIIERNSEWDDSGTGMYLPGNALRALRTLQLDENIIERGARIETQRFCDHRGRVLCEVKLGSVWGQTGPCIAIRRADLHAAMRKSKNAPPIRMGVSLRSLHQTSESVVVHLSDDCCEEYDLVIGADGIGSAVRQLAFVDAGPRALKQWGWRFIIPCSPQIATWSVLMSRKSACLTMPTGGGNAYCYVDLIGEEPPTGPEVSMERLQEVLSDFGGPAPVLQEAVKESVSIHSAPIEEVVLSRWSRGRVLLVGDAAHAMSPNMAQGAAMAVEDALMLAECLSERPSIETVLAAYEAGRRPRVDWVLAMTHRRDRIRDLHPVLRNALMRCFGRAIYRSHYRPMRVEPNTPVGD